MKLRITFKDPGQIQEATQDFISDLTEKLMKEKQLCKEAALVEAQTQAKPFVDIVYNFFEWGEYVTVELDSETKDARVVPRSEW